MEKKHKHAVLGSANVRFCFYRDLLGFWLKGALGTSANFLIWMTGGMFW